MEKLGIVLLLLFTVSQVNSLHLIGLPRDEVVKKMQESSFVIDNTSRNTTFNYIKYVDRFEEKTLLIFLSKEDICTSTKLMSDYSSFKETINDFNKRYKKVSAKEWTYEMEGKSFNVILKKEEWFYSVIVTPKNK